MIQRARKSGMLVTNYHRREMEYRVSSRLTPVDDSYGTCELTYADLVIGHVDPDVITNELGLAPTRSQVKGHPKKSPRGEVMSKITVWVFSSEGQVQSKDLRRHLDWLLEKLIPFSDRLHKLQQFPGATMAIWCYWESAHGDGGPALWPEQMETMARLNLECTISIGNYGDQGRETGA